MSNAGNLPPKVGGSDAILAALIDESSGASADLRALLNSTALNVAIVNANGDQVTSFGGGSGGTAMTDDAVFTPASDQGTPIMGFADETAPDAVDEGDIGVVRMTLQRALHVNLRDAAGAELSVGGGTQYTEDAAAAANPVGNAIIVVRDDARGGSLVSADGDNVALRGTNAGELYVKHVDAIPVTDNSTTLSVDDGAGSLTVDGTVTVQDGGGAISIDDNGSSITVDGTVDTELTTADLDTGAGTDTRAVVGLVLAASGGGLLVGSANPMPVSDNGTTLSIDDGGGVVTVDGTVNAAQSGTWTVQPGNTANTTPWLASIHDGTTKATVRDLAANDALNVAIVDGSGDQITSFGGGTQYTEDAAAAADPVGTVPILVRSDTPATQVSADGDNIAQRGTNYGAAYVTLLDTGGSPVSVGGGTQYTEDAAAAADPIGTALNLIRKDTLAGLTSADGDNVAARGTDKGELYVKHVDAIPVTDNGGALTVDNGGTFVVQENGAALTALQLIDDVVRAEDEASGDGHKGVVILARRTATPANTSGADLDYEVPQMSAGRLWTSATVDAALPAGNNNIGDVDIASVAAGVVIEVVGDVAADAAVPSNPVVIGARASTAIPTAVSADGDSVNVWANRSGAPVVTMAPHVGLNSDPFNLVHETAQYTTTQTGTALVTPTSGKKLVVTQVQIQVGGTTAGNFQLWFGGSADTTYTRGTDRAIFDGEFAPSATLKPGVVMTGPWIAGAADDVLRVTDSAAINPLTVTVWYYEI